MLATEVFRVLTAQRHCQRRFAGIALALTCVGWLVFAGTVWFGSREGTEGILGARVMVAGPLLLAVCCTLMAALWFYALRGEGPVATFTENVRELLGQAMNAASVGVVLVDAARPDLPIIYVNRAFSTITGYAPEEVQGRNARFLHGNGTDARALDEVRRAIQEVRPCAVRLLNYRKDGALFWNDLRVSPIRDQGGRVLYFLGILIDVTAEVIATENLARVNTELERRVDERTAALVQRERHLRGILDNIADMVITIDERGRVTSFNAAAEQALGWREAEIVGQDIAVIAADPDRSRHPSYIERYLRTGESRIMGVRARELIARRKDGTTLPIELTIGEIRNNGTRSFVGAMRDITERRRQQERLEASETRFRMLAAATPFGLCVSRLDNTEILYVNEALARMHGSSAAALIGRRTTDLYHDAHDWLELIDTLRIHGHVAETELQCRRIDGTPVWLMLSAALTELDGVPAVITGIYDISRRRDAEARLRDAAEALRRSEQELRLVADNLPMILTYVDRDERYRFANRTASLWYGKPVSDIIGSKVSDVLLPEAYARVHNYVRRGLAGEFVRFEDTLTYPGGRTRHVEVQYVPHRLEDGRLAGFFTVVADVTERSQMEEQLRQSQRMETIGQLTGGIAHDFNNFLGVIIGNLDLAIRDVQNMPRPRELIERAIAGTQRAAALVQRLLSFSRRQSLQPTDIDTNHLVEELAAFAARSLGESIRMTLDLAPDTWHCRADRVQLESALMNLAMNARDAMPSGGTIGITTLNRSLDAVPADQVSDLPPGDYVQIMVADDGIGMDPAVLGRAFEPFFTTKEVGAGTGLGLSMVYGFVRQSGGDVRIESAPGRGTAVHLLLPRAAAGGQAECVCGECACGSDERSLIGAGRVILVVEDDPALRRFSVSALQELGFETVEAATADEGAAALRARPDIALLFSDVMLPGGRSGIDLAREAKTIRPDLLLLFTSGFVGKHTEVGEELITEETLLPKPFRVSDLAARLARLLRERAPQAASGNQSTQRQEQE